jgi:hypothetical protein
MCYNGARNYLKSSEVIHDNVLIVTVFVLSDLVTCSTNRFVHNAWLA